jgi:hypothetical protein
MACKWFSICPLRMLEKQGKITDKWKKEYCLSENNWINCKRYQCEENGEYHPNKMMPDSSIKK